MTIYVYKPQNAQSSDAYLAGSLASDGENEDAGDHCEIDIGVSNGGKVLTRDAVNGCSNFKVDLDLENDVSVDMSSWKVRVSYNDTGHDEAWRDSQMQLAESSMKSLLSLS